jgi:hypothetical protein
VTDSGLGVSTVYRAEKLALDRHRPPLSEGIDALANAASAGLPPVSVPVIAPAPKEQVIVPPSGFGHVTPTVGTPTLRLPLSALVHATLVAVGRPVTGSDALQPIGFVLVQELNVSAVRVPPTGTPAPPPAPVLPPTVETEHEIVGLMNPPDVLRTAVVPVFSLAVTAVPAG